jgi:hypothetical protein
MAASMKRTVPVLRSFAVRALGGVPELSEAQIVGAATPWANPCGVYFLICNGRVMYIGQAVNVASRLAQHHKEKQPFDAVAVLECDRKDLDTLESLYIHRLQPEWNGRHRNGELVAPMRRTEVWKNRSTNNGEH